MTNCLHICSLGNQILSPMEMTSFALPFRGNRHRQPSSETSLVQGVHVGILAAVLIQLLFTLWSILTFAETAERLSSEYINSVVEENSFTEFPEAHDLVSVFRKDANNSNDGYPYSHNILTRPWEERQPSELCTHDGPERSRSANREMEESEERLTEAFGSLVDEYLAPWVPLAEGTDNLTSLQPITRNLLNSMEVILRGGAFRVRLAGDGQVRYRVLEHWTQTYRVSRMTWTLGILQEAMQRWPEFGRVKCEFFVNVADSPRSTIDSMSRDMGAIPVFSFRSSKAYLDIPVPDPVEFGANGNYVWQSEDQPPLQNRQPKLVFRGSSSSLLEYHDDNWLIVPRLRLASLSRQFPDLIDAGITKWMKVDSDTSIEEIEKAMGTTSVDSLSFGQQSQYRYVLDVDGGLGSSRKRGILGSGSVPFFQQSNWYNWYEPLLREGVHYVGIDKFLHQLIRKVKWAGENLDECIRIVERAQCFSKSVVSYNAALLYWKILLEGYSQLQRYPATGDEEVSPSMCSMRPAAAEGPMGCTRGWYKFNGTVPFGCRWTAEMSSSPFKFECWRDIGYGQEFKFTNDPVHSLYAQEIERRENLQG